MAGEQSVSDTPAHPRELRGRTVQNMKDMWLPPPNLKLYQPALNLARTNSIWLSAANPIPWARTEKSLTKATLPRDQLLKENSERFPAG